MKKRSLQNPTGSAAELRESWERKYLAEANEAREKLDLWWTEVNAIKRRNAILQGRIREYRMMWGPMTSKETWTASKELSALQDTEVENCFIRGMACASLEHVDLGPEEEYINWLEYLESAKEEASLDPWDPSGKKQNLPRISPFQESLARNLSGRK